jgi:hypothetical protein
VTHLSPAAGGPSALAAAGLVLDIAGALMLAFGLMFKKPDVRVEETSTKLGWNTDLEIGLAEQTADAQIGAALLIVGFAFQLTAALGSHVQGWTATAVAIGAAVMVDLFAYWFLKQRWRPRHVKAMLAARIRRIDLGDWPSLLAMYGERLGYASDGGVTETSLDFMRRILGSQRTDEITSGRELPAPLSKLRRDVPGTQVRTATGGRA